MEHLLYHSYGAMEVFIFCRVRLDYIGSGNKFTLRPTVSTMHRPTWTDIVLRKPYRLFQLLLNRH